ncbi:MAG: methionine--tRNA ligase subunit beta, partial [Deltaproteobacteria bacterium]|nr:methionine--tRNA ligase subunit beta [Deltaproteobacteria bacterium]
MPETAETMQEHLGQKDIKPDSEKVFYDLELLRTWNRIRPGTKLPKRITLFRRIETKEKKETVSGSLIPEIKPEISMDEFAKVDLRVATVVHAESIPKAQKLLKLEVDLGEKRPIVAGISTHYTPEEMIGKQVIIVANLKPARLMGVLSKGMLLAAVDGNGCTVATLDKRVEPGTQLK